MLQHYHAPGMRFTMAGTCALLVTFLILLVMRSLVHSDDVPKFDGAKRLPLPTFIRVPVSEADVTDTVERKPDRMQEQPPLPDTADWDELGPAILIVSNPGPVIDPGRGRDFPAPLINTELISVVDMQPVYPQRAIARNIEGYVVVEFSVTESGSTDDLRVVEAYPENIFDGSAIKAASKSRYRPKIVDGTAVRVTGLRKKYTFEFHD